MEKIEYKDLQELEEMLVAACEARKAEGLTIKPHILGHRDYGHCCMVGALVADRPMPGEDGYVMLEHIFGSSEAVEELFNGFDNPYEAETELARVGARVRARVLGDV